MLFRFSYLLAHSVRSFSKAFQLHSGVSCLRFLFLAQTNRKQTFVGTNTPALPLHATQKTHAMRKLSIALLIAILSPTCFHMPLVLPGDDILPFPNDGINVEFGDSPDERLCHTRYGADNYTHTLTDLPEKSGRSCLRIIQLPKPGNQTRSPMPVKTPLP